jgi:hypothetical protein
MIQRLSEAFEYPDESEVERMICAPEVLGSINYFFTAEGPTKVVITQEIAAPPKEEPFKKKGGGPLTMAEEKALAEAIANIPQTKLQVYMQDVDVLPDVAVYFMKPKKGKDNDDHYAIDPTKINDGALTFGVLRAPLESLEVTIRCVYRPMIQELGVETWGETSAEQKHEFLNTLERMSIIAEKEDESYLFLIKTF